MIRSENLRSIGLKKTLVFYSGKAPKGIRTSWIMNEYRLPHHETERLQKAEISLCRVYKRAGVEDHPSLPRSLPTKASSSSSSRGSQSTQKPQEAMNLGIETFQTEGIMSESSPCSSTNVGTSLALSNLNSYNLYPLLHMASTIDAAAPSSVERESMTLLQNNSQQICTTIFANPSSSHAIDDLHKLVNNYSTNQENHHFSNNIIVPGLLSHFSTLQPQPQQQHQLAPNVIPGSIQAAYSDRLWDWNSISDQASNDYNSHFK